MIDHSEYAPLVGRSEMFTTLHLVLSNCGPQNDYCSTKYQDQKHTIIIIYLHLELELSAAGECEEEMEPKINSQPLQDALSA